MLTVPDHPCVLYIEGDGVGGDIWKASVRVLNAAVSHVYRDTRKIHWQEILAGQKAFDQTGKWLPQATIDAIEQHLLVLQGPLTVPMGGGIRSLNVALQQQFDLYTSHRRIQRFEGLPGHLQTSSPMKIDIFQESMEGVQAGMGAKAGSDKTERWLEYMEDEFPEDFAKISFASEEKLDAYQALLRQPSSTQVELGLGISFSSRQGTERLIRSAIHYAIQHHKSSVLMVHRGNQLPFTEGAFRDWGYRLAEKEFGDQVYTWAQYDRTAAIEGLGAAREELLSARSQGKLMIRDLLLPIAWKEILNQPEEIDVIVLPHLTGSYLIDMLLGLLNVANLTPVGRINHLSGHAVFEVAHGTAIPYSGKDVFNPSSMIMAGGLLLEYMGWQEAADLIWKAMERTLSQQTFTHDLHRQTQSGNMVSCSEFGDALIRNMS